MLLFRSSFIQSRVRQAKIGSDEWSLPTNTSPGYRLLRDSPNERAGCEAPCVQRRGSMSWCVVKFQTFHNPICLRFAERFYQGMIFVDLCGTRDRLSMRSMQSMIAEAGQRAGLDRQEPPVFVTSHVLRHTWLYMLRQKGISAEVRAALAGHSLETTMKYGSPKSAKIERAVAALDDAATI